MRWRHQTSPPCPPATTTYTTTTTTTTTKRARAWLVGGGGDLEPSKPGALLTSRPPKTVMPRVMPSRRTLCDNHKHSRGLATAGRGVLYLF